MNKLILFVGVSLALGCTRVYNIKVQRSIQSICDVSKDECITVVSQCEKSGCRITAWGKNVEEALQVEGGFWSWEHRRQMEEFLAREGRKPWKRAKWMRHWAEVMKR